MQTGKKALVLSGGGIKGAFQAGAIAAILEQGFAPDIIVGTSVGSLNGTFLADRAGRARLAGTPVDWPSLGRELEAFWRRRIRSPGDVITKKGTLRLVFEIAFSKFTGVVGIEPWKKLVATEVTLANIRASGITLSVETVNVIDGQLVSADPTVPPYQDNFLDYVVGSAAMPLVMPLIDIGGALYTDGGLREVAPFGQAIDL